MKHLIKNKNKIHLPAHIEILKTGEIILCGLMQEVLANQHSYYMSEVERVWCIQSLKLNIVLKFVW